MVSTPQIHENIVAAWRAGEEKTICNAILIKCDGTVTLINRIMVTTFNPYGSEESLRDFLSMYVR